MTKKFKVITKVSQNVTYMIRANTEEDAMQSYYVVDPSEKSGHIEEIESVAGMLEVQPTAGCIEVDAKSTNEADELIKEALNAHPKIDCDWVTTVPLGTGIVSKPQEPGRNWIVCYVDTDENDKYQVFDCENDARALYEGLKDRLDIHSASLNAVIESTDYETHPKFLEIEV